MLAQHLAQQLPAVPTEGQKVLFSLLEQFLTKPNLENPVFLLRGYAGTGKTTVISALVTVLKRYGYKSLLLAPTGRSAKVMAVYSGRKAFTIHKVIYQQKEDSKTGKIYFVRRKNNLTQTIFIADEASMIQNESSFGKTGVLTDLIRYIFENQEANNKLILVGDHAQLPPVGQAVSPALDADTLQSIENITLFDYELTEVVRQAQKSGILDNATMIRQKIETGELNIKFQTAIYPDVYRMTSEKLEDGINYAYRKFGIEDSIIITRSNKTATQYNQYIRNKIRFLENEIDSGDYLMIVRNDYFWLPEESEAGFLANGEFVKVLRVNRTEEMYDMKFADVTLQLIDYPNHEPFEAKVHLSTLYSFAPALEEEPTRKLYEAIQKEYADEPNVATRNKLVRENPYLNALQVKFAYALTCHKAQGGQWQIVFIDQGYLTQEMYNIEFLRWLYTAVTRAEKELYLVNFDAKFLA